MKITSIIIITFITLNVSAQIKIKIPDLKLPVKSGSGSLSNDDAVSGLKEALRVGTDTAVSRLSKSDGFYKDEMVKIFLPDEAQKVYKNISKIPGGKDLVEKNIMAMNRAAEDASKEAAPIFKNAITGMSVNDGISIVKGSDSAATEYLKGHTYDQLKSAFTPKIRESLSKPLVAGVSAETSYRELVETYNKASMNGMLFEKISGQSLTEHVTTKGLDGLFKKVALEEKNIRKNPVAQVTGLLKKVFGKR